MCECVCMCVHVHTWYMIHYQSKHLWIYKDNQKRGGEEYHYNIIQCCEMVGRSNVLGKKTRTSMVG